MYIYLSYDLYTLKLFCEIMQKQEEQLLKDVASLQQLHYSHSQTMRTTHGDVGQRSACAHEGHVCVCVCVT